MKLSSLAIRGVTTATIFCGMSSEALACSVCCTSLTDYVLPPIGLWSLLAVAWFLTNGAVRDLTGRKLPWQPGFVWSILVTLLLAGLGAAIVGLGVMYLLFIPPVVGFARAALSRSEANPNGRKATRVAGWIYLSGVICASALLVHTHLTRKPEQFLCKWGTNGPSSLIFARLESEEPASLESYRYLVRNGDTLLVVKAAERIGDIGDPAVDIPLLKESLPLANESQTRRVRAALSKLESRSSK